MKLAQIAGHNQSLCSLSFNEKNEGTPIILIHGLFCSVHFWHSDYLRFLFDFGPAYAVSLPAHAPARVDSSWRYRDESTLVDAIDQQIQAVAAGRQVILIGHSTGGTLALLYALTHPERVRAIVTVGAADSGLEEPGIFGWMQSVLQNGGAIGRWVLAAFIRLNASNLWVHKQFIKSAMVASQNLLVSAAR